jgi:hypothetical protein
MPNVTHIKANHFRHSPKKQSHEVVQLFVRILNCQFTSGLPVGFFSCQKSQIGLLCRAMEWKILVYFTAMWYILYPIGMLCGYLVHFCQFWHVAPKKSGSAD